ncbi:MAG TPA: ribonuclease Z [Anaeromyxobacteraceae bacterium]|nr:ribonuclease Z [Anaeromyxobacteraceae bacterium]
MLRVTFLGTSAAQPTVRRNLSGLAVRHGRELWLFDCGEGTQRQMIAFGTGFDVSAIFFTHFHADHWVGAIGFLRTLSMAGREQPLDLYGPSPARRLLESVLFAGADAFGYEVRVHEIEAGAEVRREGARLIAFQVDHRIAAVGWLLAEDGRPGRFHPDRAAALGVPEGPLYGELQRGRPVEVNGRVISPAEVVEPPRRGRRVAVSGDTRPCPGTVEAARHADLLVHEATFGDAEEARARETMHSTAREAARVAREAGAKRLALTHLSTRYDADPSPLLAQAAEEYQGDLLVAHDGLAVEIPLPD